MEMQYTLIDLINTAVKQASSFEECQDNLNTLRQMFGQALNGYSVVVFKPEEDGALTDLNVLECDGVHICSPYPHECKSPYLVDLSITPNETPGEARCGLVVDFDANLVRHLKAAYRGKEAPVSFYGLVLQLCDHLWPSLRISDWPFIIEDCLKMNDNKISSLQAARYNHGLFTYYSGQSPHVFVHDRPFSDECIDLFSESSAESFDHVITELQQFEIHTNFNLIQAQKITELYLWRAFLCKIENNGSLSDKFVRFFSMISADRFNLLEIELIFAWNYLTDSKNSIPQFGKLNELAQSVGHASCDFDKVCKEIHNLSWDIFHIRSTLAYTQFDLNGNHHSLTTALPNRGIDPQNFGAIVSFHVLATEDKKLTECFDRINCVALVITPNNQVEFILEESLADIDAKYASDNYSMTQMALQRRTYPSFVDISCEVDQEIMSTKENVLKVIESSKKP